MQKQSSCLKANTSCHSAKCKVLTNFVFSDLPPKQYVCKLLYKLKKQTTIIKLSFVARLLLFVYPLVACFVP